MPASQGSKVNPGPRNVLEDPCHSKEKFIMKRILEGVIITRSRILGLFMGVSLLCVLPMRAQESRPVSERPASSSRDLAAEPNSFAINRGVSQEAQAAAPRVLKFSGVLLDAEGKPLSGEVEVTFALY
jgi:hypothetical protein